MVQATDCASGCAFVLQAAGILQGSFLTCVHSYAHLGCLLCVMFSSVSVYGVLVCASSVARCVGAGVWSLTLRAAAGQYEVTLHMCRCGLC